MQDEDLGAVAGPNVEVADRAPHELTRGVDLHHAVILAEMDLRVARRRQAAAQALHHLSLHQPTGVGLEEVPARDHADQLAVVVDHRQLLAILAAENPRHGVEVLLGLERPDVFTGEVRRHQEV